MSKTYLVSEETLKEAISGLKAHGGSATEITVEKLESLDVFNGSDGVNVSRTIPYKDNEEVVINGVTWVYNMFYRRLERKELDGEPPHTICASCHGTQFSISYAPYEVFAHCSCGHSFLLADS